MPRDGLGAVMGAVLAALVGCAAPAEPVARPSPPAGFAWPPCVEFPDHTCTEELREPAGQVGEVELEVVRLREDAPANPVHPARSTVGIWILRTGGQGLAGFPLAPAPGAKGPLRFPMLVWEGQAVDAPTIEVGANRLVLVRGDDRVELTLEPLAYVGRSILEERGGVRRRIELRPGGEEVTWTCSDRSTVSAWALPRDGEHPSPEHTRLGDCAAILDGVSGGLVIEGRAAPLDGQARLARIGDPDELWIDVLDDSLTPGDVVRLYRTRPDEVVPRWPTCPLGRQSAPREPDRIVPVLGEDEARPGGVRRLRDEGRSSLDVPPAAVRLVIPLVSHTAEYAVEYADDDGRGVERRIASAPLGLPWTWRIDDDAQIGCELHPDLGGFRVSRRAGPRTGYARFLDDFAPYPETRSDAPPPR